MQKPNRKSLEDVVIYYKDNAKSNERLGKMIERVGMEPFEKAVSLKDSLNFVKKLIK